MKSFTRKMVLPILLTAAFCAGTARDSRAQEAFLGEIRMFAGNFPPRGWAFCQGQILQINQNTALFSILGTTYGGNGTTTFALPDLQGRVPMGPGLGPGLTPRTLGESGGQEMITLSQSNLPAHTHSLPGVQVSTETATEQVAGTNGANTLAAPTVAGRSVQAYNNATPGAALNGAGTSSGSTGSGIPVNNMQPYTAINFIICLQGIYPSRD